MGRTISNFWVNVYYSDSSRYVTGADSIIVAKKHLQDEKVSHIELFGQTARGKRAIKKDYILINRHGIFHKEIICQWLPDGSEN
jgi:hypothetical protein